MSRCFTAYAADWNRAGPSGAELHQSCSGDSMVCVTPWFVTHQGQFQCKHSKQSPHNFICSCRFILCHLLQLQVSSGMFHRLDFLIKMAKRECCFLNFHVQFSCDSYSGQGTPMTFFSSRNLWLGHNPVLIFRTKSTALLVLTASPCQSCQSWEDEIKGKGTSKVSPVRGETFQHCTFHLGKPVLGKKLLLP